MRHRETRDGAEFVKVYEADAAEAFEAVDHFRKTNSADIYLIADSYRNGSFGNIIGLNFQLKSQYDASDTFEIATDQIAAIQGLSFVKNLRDVYMESISQNLHYMNTILTNPDALQDPAEEDIKDHLFEMTDVIYQEYTHTLNEMSSIGLTITSAKTKTGSEIMLAETVDASGKAVAVLFENGELVYLNHQYKSAEPSEFEDFTKAVIEADLAADTIQSLTDIMLNNIKLDPEELTQLVVEQTEGKVDEAVIRSFAQAMALKVQGLTDAALFTEEIGEIESSYEEIRQVKLVATLLGIIRSGSEEQ